MDTVIISSYKTLETMVEVRHQSPRVIRSLATPHLTNGTRCSQLLLPSHSCRSKATRIPHLRYMRCSREPIGTEIPLLWWLCESPLRYDRIRSISDRAHCVQMTTQYCVRYHANEALHLYSYYPHSLLSVRNRTGLLTRRSASIRLPKFQGQNNKP